MQNAKIKVLEKTKIIITILKTAFQAFYPTVLSTGSPDQNILLHNYLKLKKQQEQL